MKKKNHSGFTLIEAMVTISVLGILLSMAVPSFTSMIERNRVSTAASELMNALMLARSEAVTRSIGMTLCVSNDGATCNTTLQDYAKGWIIFTDCNQDGQISSVITACDVDGDGTNDKDRVLKVQDGFKNIVMIATTAANKNVFSYSESGRPVSGVAGFNIGKDSSSTTRKITVALTGRTKVAKVE